jgi:hypothetical protein
VASSFRSFGEVRYVFHLYPLLVILFVWGLVQAATRCTARLDRVTARAAVVSALFAVGFLASSDIGVPSWTMGRPSYSTPVDPMRSVISWEAYAAFRQDHEGPGRFVRDHARPSDRIAAIGLPHHLAITRFYTGRLDIALGRPEDASYQRRRGGRLVDWVTGAEVVYDPEQLSAAAQGTAVWLLGDDVLTRDDVPYFASDVRRDARALAGRQTFRGRDGVTFAVKLP